MKAVLHIPKPTHPGLFTKKPDHLANEISNPFTLLPGLESPWYSH